MVAARYIGKTRKRSRVLTANEIRIYLRIIYRSNIRRRFKPALHIFFLQSSQSSAKRWWANYVDNIVNESKVILGNFGGGNP
jgi:hypothetical protein